MKKALFSLVAIGLAGLLMPACAHPMTDDYASASQFIGARNIFDASRHLGSIEHPQGVSTPAGKMLSSRVQFVGTMSYEKGMFAFFSGNNADLSQVAQVGGKLQDYTIASITSTNVVIVAADNKEQIDLQIGDGLRQENNKWTVAKEGELPADSGSSSTSSSSPSGSGNSSSSSSSSTPATPPSSTEQNDVLKRLMEQREKENQ